MGVSLGILGGCSIGTVKANDKKRPNIILIMADDIGFEGISAYGSLSYKTPVLDKLAKEGMRFDYCYSQPICTPSRVEIMTGKYNFRNYTKFGQLDPKEITFGNLLKDAGYETLVAGKWQLGGGAEKVRGFGFDNHCLWHIEGRESRFWEPRIMIDGKVKTKEIKDRYGPDVICDYVTDFIKKPKSKPFFVYYPMTLVHYPYVPTPDSPEGGSRTREGHWDGKKGGEEYFDDMVAYMDKCIGRVVDTLEKQGLRDNTLLIFTGDNGCTPNIYSKMPDRTIQGGKGYMTDAGTDVALIANWPGTVKPNQVTDALVDFTDLLPTLTQAAAVDIPDSLAIDGKSFLPLLKGDDYTGREWVFCHYTRNGRVKRPNKKEKQQATIEKNRGQMQQKKMGRFVRNRRYKLYDTGQFYDAENDVLEKKPIDLSKADSKTRDVHRQLKKVLDGYPKWQDFKD